MGSGECGHAGVCVCAMSMMHLEKCPTTEQRKIRNRDERRIHEKKLKARGISGI